MVNLKNKDIISIRDFTIEEILYILNMARDMEEHSYPDLLKGKVLAHSHDPVPLVLCGGPITPGHTQDFSEESCRKGSLGEIKGTQLMPRIVKYIKG